MARYLLDLEANTLDLEEELRSGTWRPEGYRVFRITDPKERTICAAPFRDRVVHQALVQVVESLIERAFIFDSYACRRGKGTHAALARVARWARTRDWCLKLDIEKYFPSIDHGILLGLLDRRIRCERTLALFARILATWSSDEAPRRLFPGDDLLTALDRPRGLPIGNLTSQFCANVYLDPVDHRIKDGLGMRAYARYCDDLVLLDGEPGRLRRARDEITSALDRLRLTAHPRKSHLFPTSQGVPWVGFRVFPRTIHLRQEGVRRVRRRFRKFARRLASSFHVRGALLDSTCAWLGHARHCTRPAFVDSLLGPLRPLLERSPPDPRLSKILRKGGDGAESPLPLERVALPERQQVRAARRQSSDIARWLALEGEYREARLERRKREAERRHDSGAQQPCVDLAIAPPIRTSNEQCGDA